MPWYKRIFVALFSTHLPIICCLKIQPDIPADFPKARQFLIPPLF